MTLDACPHVVGGGKWNCACHMDGYEIDAILNFPMGDTAAPEFQCFWLLHHANSNDAARK